jgi:hypothetical protein
MSIVSEIWSGNDLQQLHRSMSDTDFETPSTTAAFIKDNNVFYEPGMRWNKNTKESRVRECWVCGVETNDFYSHQWRTQDGKISNIKCSECYDKYLEDKKKS